MNDSRENLMRSWGNLFAGFVFLGINAITTFVGISTTIWTAKFFIIWIINILVFIFGILILTTFTYSYIDNGTKSVVQKGRILLFFPDPEVDIQLEINRIREIRIKMRRLWRSVEFTPLLFDQDGKEYAFESTEVWKLAKRIAEKIRIAVIKETGNEPNTYIPTREEVKNFF